MAGVVPLLVPLAQLQHANAFSSAGRTTAMMLGPATGGLIVATAGPGWGLAVDAATFLLAAAWFARLRLPRGVSANGSSLAALREGWVEFSSRTWIWVVVVAFSVLNALYAGAWLTLGPIVAEGTFGPDGWGWALAAMAAGMMTGTLLLLRLSFPHPLRAAMAGALLLAVPSAALGVSPPFALLVAAAFIGGIGFDLFTVTWETALHQHVRPERLSRVASYDMLGSFVAIPAGQALAGTAADTFHAAPVILTAAAAYVLVGAAALCTPAVWRLRQLTSTGASVAPSRLCEPSVTQPP